MPVFTFPFVQTHPEAPPRPYLPIRLTNPHTGREVNVYALVDTGADECALPAAFAALPGHHLEEGAPRTVSTGNGVTMAYGHTTRISFEGFTTADVVIDYMPNLNTPLLGVASFLSRFTVTIDYPQRVFSLALPG